jgi:fructose-1,6-bisphosphatase/inositol monophosphatase family enzyme
VQRARETDGDDTLGATQKDATDPKSALTVADTAAQVAVMTVLRSRWPGLCIIGEEDEEADEGDSAAAGGEPVTVAAGESRCVTTLIRVWVSV